jgi:hypothetical protein
VKEKDGSDIGDIPGVNAVKDWFGYWPTFHDAEITSLCLNRRGESRLKIHPYSKTNHAVVCFLLEEIQRLELTDFSEQNVISCLQLTKGDGHYLIELGPCYGLCGSIAAARVRVEIEPGPPADSI